MTANRPDNGDVFRLKPHDEQAGLHHITKRRPGCGQSKRDVVECLLGLSTQIAAPNEFSLLVDCDLSRYMDRRATRGGAR